MSDGSLSQDEIDALLGGGGAGEPNFDNEAKALQGVLNDLVGPLGGNLSSMINQEVGLSDVKVEVIDDEGLKAGLPEEIAELNVDFQEAVAGRHCLIMPAPVAANIAGLMMGMEQVELDDAALEAVVEAANTVSGTLATVLGDKAGDTLMTAPGTGRKAATADYSFKDGKYIKATYAMKIGDAEPVELVELFDPDMLKKIFAPKPAEAATGGLGGQAQQPPNVQDVNLPNLNQQSGAGGQANISLLMDVSMEMSVELGRTRRQVKEILSMGEGTIIELDKLAGEPVDILVNHRLIAKGEVVVIDENFGVRVTEIVSQIEGLPKP